MPIVRLQFGESGSLTVTLVRATSPGTWNLCSRKVGALIAIVDAGPLYAAADLDDADHDRSLAVRLPRQVEMLDGLIVSDSAR